MPDFGVKNCIECGKPLVGRKDKKFCDTECRASHHNQIKSSGELGITHVQKILRHNRKILKTLSPHGKTTVRKDVLDQMGYDYRHFTSLFKSSKTLYYLVYDFAFSPILEGKVEKALIVQRQDYMDKLGFDIWRRTS